MSIAIKVENLSKQYRLGKVGTGTLSHDLNRWWHLIRGKEDPYLKIGDTNDRSTKGESEYVWALKDINFEIEQGDAVGIIGRNGAGKSTLLKILSRTTAPTTGQVKLRGRVASLLEVGTGFHPELSGRENIYLNGAILGMTRREITKKFEEIVDFSGVERYIDTPVKRYSSGMYVRLAFAVAAHLESEILIVDEVLAVGDAEFQKKCLGKMGDVSKGEGRTVLFVSHNLEAIRTFCTIGLHVSKGNLEGKAEINSIIQQYLGGNIQIFKHKYISENNENNLPIKIDFASISTRSKNDNLSFFEDIEIEVFYTVNQKLYNSNINFILSNFNTDILWSFDTDFNYSFIFNREPGVYKAKIIIPNSILKPGIYSLNFNTGILGGQIYESIKECLVFRIFSEEKSDFYKSYSAKRKGLIALPLNWITEKVQ